MKKISLHLLKPVLMAFMVLIGVEGWGTNLINENIQAWTSQTSYGTYTQVISAGTVNLTDCIISPSGAVSGTGTVGYVQVKATTGIISLPAIASCGTVEVRIHAGGAGRSLKLQSYNGSSWVDLTTFSGIGTTGTTFTYTVNSGSSTTLRLSTASAAVYVHDIIISNYSSTTAPTVTTSAASGETSSSATLNGNITATGGADATERGFYYSITDGFADGSGTKISSIGTFGTGVFSETPTLLSASTTYYFKAFATNSAGTSYGSQASFVTSAPCTPQTITFGTLTAKTYGDASFSLTATASSGLSVSYSSSNTAVATVSGSTVTIVGAGSTTITASQAGDGTYCAATPVDQSLTVNTKELTVTSAAASNKTYDGTNAATITGSLSGIVGADVVTLTGTGTFASVNVANGISVTSTSTLGGADAAKYTLTQPTGLTANITKADQTINLASTDSKYESDADYTLAATSATSATNALSYSSSNTSVATIDASTGLVHIVAVGTTVFTVSQGGNSNYNAATDATQTLTVNVAPCGSEDFASIPTTSSTTYLSRNWTGTNGGTWSATDARTDQTISGSAITLRTGTLTSPLISGGIEDLTFKTKFPFSETTGTLTIEVNGSSVGTVDFADMNGTTPITKLITGINVSGDITVTITSADARFTIDDISWTCYAGSINPEPTNHVTGFAATSLATTHSSITLEWTDASGAQLPDGYLVKASTVGFGSIATPSDGSAEADATLVKNVAYGVETIEFTGLTSNTTYYFKIWPYTNSGSIIDYKTDGTVPSVSATTDIQLLAPTATAATNISKTGFTANWNAVSGATGYEIDVYTQVNNPATDLFISEYVEGSSNNKYIEIFNGTGVTVNLSDYKLQMYPNGASSPNNDVTLSGTLTNGTTIIFKNSSAALTLPNGVSASDNTAVSYNGDDAVALYKISTSSYVDIFGRIGNDPGTAWTGDGGYSTLDKTLVRKASVMGGITTSPSGTGASAFTTLTTEWDLYNQDVVSNLGSHSFSSGASTTYAIQNQSVTGTSYVVTGLDSAETYYYVVRAVNSTQTTVNSNEIVLSTKPGSVMDINIVPGANSATITWTRGNGDGVLVKVSNAPFILASKPNDGTDYSSSVSTDYSSGTGEQWVYDGIGTSVEITLPGGFDINTLNVAIFEYSTYDDGSKAVNKVYNQGKVLVYDGEEGYLPINLLGFTARNQSFGVELLWSTATEINNDYFTVERSDDGSIFYEIGRIDGEGNSNKILDYRFIDFTDFNNIVYYRLKQTDYDGQFSYSKIVDLIDDKTSQNIDYLVINQSVLQLNISSKFNVNASFKLISTDGRLLIDEALSLNKGNQNYQINLPKLASGIYLINLVSDQGVNTMKVFVP